jgi:hypothetical protein
MNWKYPRINAAIRAGKSIEARKALRTNMSTGIHFIGIRQGIQQNVIC